MDSFLLLFCFLLIGVVANNAALMPAQVYWHTILPNTPMPAALSDLLNSRKDGFYVGGRNWKVERPTLHIIGDYAFAATEKQLNENLHVSVYFLEQDLHPGSKMNLRFDRLNDVSKFVPRSEAESIPFSSKKLPEIMRQFSVQPGSNEEKAIKETLKQCEHPTLKGEIQMCATTLESIVDFTIASLGTTNVISAATKVHSKNVTPKQEYTIVSLGTKNLAQNLVACHPQTYPYGVFYCHLTTSTKSYTVKMAGKDGTVVDAVAVCHTDTLAWNPKHLSFQMLNMKPGTVPVCHFMPQNHIFFTPKN